MPYQSTKTFGHELGLSCCFRQWRADSHCAQLHGYALSFKFTFEATHLDDKNWVQDFGGLKELKLALVNHFDHTLVVAEDDPLKDELCMLGGLDVAHVIVLPAVGCEAFARQAFEMAVKIVETPQQDLFHESGNYKRIRVVSCEVSEHGANSAIYKVN